MINKLVNALRPLVKKVIGPSLRPFVNRIYFNFAGLLYTGDKVYCFCCQKKYSKFLPYRTYGHHTRQNAQCPGCGSLERHRLMMAFLQEKTEVFREKVNLLHFAPEDTLQRRFSKMQNIKYLSVDLFSPLAMQRMDIMDLPINDSTYDSILCNHVLAHVEDDRKAMRELYRILKVGGWALITTTINLSIQTFEQPGPLTKEEKLEVYGQEDLCRIYGHDIIDRLEETGFDVELVDYATQLPHSKFGEYGFNKDLMLYCRRNSK